MRADLTKRRIEMGMTHDTLADKALISRPFYTNIEAGRKNPSLKVMKRIADVLQASVDSIFFAPEVPKGNVELPREGE